VFLGIYGDIRSQYHRDIDTGSNLTAILFDQGLLQSYGFNQIEGRRNFLAGFYIYAYLYIYVYMYTYLFITLISRVQSIRGDEEWYKTIS
jgi:hypothetical protein